MSPLKITDARAKALARAVSPDGAVAALIADRATLLDALGRALGLLRAIARGESLAAGPHALDTIDGFRALLASAEGERDGR